MIAGVFFTFWRMFQILTLIPTLGMLVSFDYPEGMAAFGKPTDMGISLTSSTHFRRPIC